MNGSENRGKSVPEPTRVLRSNVKAAASQQQVIPPAAASSGASRPTRSISDIVNSRDVTPDVTTAQISFITPHPLVPDWSPPYQAVADVSRMPQSPSGTGFGIER
ncbi:hypothetical protein HYFRA_00005882 [Hymenoscyphus fraxineus]|uniref:Uncharacterized protein n=1 Tax=Hymenoscyphus fraxineus TaxID=746836 RepID=A0A9N9PU85_9HELO|nr:hypothetical protein HYFRA_00005882 [Hymenoscyphus fraxineus]